MGNITRSFLVLGAMLAGATAFAGYDDSWHFVDGYLPGEYPQGIAVRGDNVVYNGRAAADPALARDVACALPKNAVLHPWNHLRRASLHFATYSKIVKMTAKEDFSYTAYVGAEERVIEFKQGDVVEYLVYGSEGWFTARFNGVEFGAEHDFLSHLESIPESAFAADEWIRASCDNGGQAWILLSDIGEAGSDGLALDWMDGGFVDWGSARDIGLATAEVESSDEGAMIHAARIDDLAKLGNEGGVDVKLVVVDHGGSTDVSPTRGLRFALYMKGEMFSTDAQFDLGNIFSFVFARRLDDGIFEIKVTVPDNDMGMPAEQIIYVNAGLAIAEMQGVRCDDAESGGFDCEASTNFKTKIFVTKPAEKTE